MPKVIREAFFMLSGPGGRGPARWADGNNVGTSAGYLVGYQDADKPRRVKAFSQRHRSHNDTDSTTTPTLQRHRLYNDTDSTTTRFRSLRP